MTLHIKVNQGRKNLFVVVAKEDLALRELGYYLPQYIEELDAGPINIRIEQVSTKGESKTESEPQEAPNA